MTAESRRYRYDGENGRGRSPRLPVLASGGFFHAAVLINPMFLEQHRRCLRGI